MVVRNREDSVVEALWGSPLPRDVLVSQILPRLFLSTHSCDIYGEYSAAYILDRVVVGLLAGWLHRSGGGTEDLACALEDVCRELAHQWYGGRVGKGSYAKYKDLVLDDNGMECQRRLTWRHTGSLIASVNRYGSDVESMSLCCVDAMEVGLKGTSCLSVMASIESNGPRQGNDIKVASIALVRMRHWGRTYGEVIQDLYYEGLYPTFMRKKSPSNEEKAKIRACDMEARQCILYPGFSSSDILSLFVSDVIVHDGGRGRVRVDFEADGMLETLEKLHSASRDDTCILFTYGSEHPLVHYQEGSKVFHPCRLEPLEILMRAKRNRVRGCTLRRMHEWIPIKNE